jgi:hypothetical protein
VANADLTRAIEAALVMAREHFGVTLDPLAVDALFRELLWGPRETWRCVEMGILTLPEAANLLVAHLHSRLLRREIQSELDWDVVGAPLQRALMQILPQFGPRALSIELGRLATLEVPRFDSDPRDSEDVRSTLCDVCTHLLEQRLVEFTFRIGTTYLPVDAIDLCIVLEQLPAAITAIAARENFVIEMYEQGIQTWLTFTRSGDDYAMSVVSHVDDNLPNGTLRADELRDMLLRVRTRFLGLVAETAPELTPKLVNALAAT